MRVMDISETLQRRIDFHGHFCIGRFLGVRIAKKGLEWAEPEREKDLGACCETEEETLCNS